MSDTSIYGFVTSHSGLTTFAICRDMFSPVTSRVPVMIRAVINMSCFIPRLRLISASSGMVSILCFVHCRLVGRPARLFTISSGSQFRPPHGLTESQFRSTLMIGTLDNFSLLHCGLVASHLSSELRRQFILCVICLSTLDISLVLTNRSCFLRHGFVFWVLFAILYVRPSSSLRTRKSSSRR